MNKIKKLPRRVGSKTGLTIEPRGLIMPRKGGKKEYKRRPPQDLRFFREELRVRGISERQAGQAIGLKPDEMSRVFSGARRLSDAEIPKAARLVEMDLVEFNRKMGTPMPRESALGGVDLMGVVDRAFMVQRYAKGHEKVPRVDRMRAVDAVRFKAPGSPYHRAVAYYRYGPQTTPESAYGRMCVCFRPDRSAPPIVRVVQPSAPSRGVFDLYNVNGELNEEGAVLSVALPIVLIRWP